MNVHDKMRDVFSLAKVVSTVKIKADVCRRLGRESGGLNGLNWSGLADELDDVVEMVQLHLPADGLPEREKDRLLVQLAQLVREALAIVDGEVFAGVGIPGGPAVDIREWRKTARATLTEDVVDAIQKL